MNATQEVIIRSRRLDPSVDSAFEGFADTEAGRAMLSSIVSTTAPAVTRQEVGNRTGARQPRVRFTALTASLLVLCLASAAGATYWLSARTGKKVEAPSTEQIVGAEIIRLDAPDLNDVVRGLAKGYPLAPGMTTDYLTDRISTDEPTEMDEVGVESVVAYLSYCGWAEEWLRAEATSDPSASHKAARVLAQVPEWDVLSMTDGGGIVDHFRRMATAVAAGDTGPVIQDVEVNCR